MLHIFRSNLVEALLDLLAHRIREAPLASPFSPEVVVSPSPAMARWVHLGLARAQGVAANLSYPLPASFVWQLARNLPGNAPEGDDPKGWGSPARGRMPEGDDPLGLDVMSWRIYAILPSLLADPAFAPLRRYLQPADNALKRWQLAGRIGDIFDRYQLYRPDLIRAWSAARGSAPDPALDADDAWQPILWRRLITGIGHHRVAVIDRLLAHLAGEGTCPRLPERLSLFAISSLPPLLVEVFHALAARTRVDLYLHAPTDQFWSDLVNQKVAARKRLDHPEEADLWEAGHPLLSSWGRQGQALQDLLLEREMPVNEVDAWATPVPDSLLHRLQHDIFTLADTALDGTRETVAADGSIQVHVCHSALRECQVLHDQLLSLFEAESDLTPEDCLVMIPEIDNYAPYIEAVFKYDESGARPYIPWNLSDTSPRDEHPLIQVFLRLLDLPGSRFGHSEILSYLDVPELAETFGLTLEDVAQIKAWLAETNLRWGLDADHKERLGLPPTEENTWVQTERRLFGGYAMTPPDPGQLGFADIASIATVEGARAEILGRFWCLLSRLRETAQSLVAPRSAAAWAETGVRLVEAFFGDRPETAGPDDGRIQRIRDALAELAEQAEAAGGDPGEGPGEPLPLDLMRHWLAERLGTASRHGRYFRGGVTFCGMRPMRSLPFQVICILGLQDQAFPRRDRPLEFDLMRRHWRPGDPRKGDEDRYLFLETLLCTRRRLYLSYIGRDLRRNTERQPSVLLRELLDTLDQRWRLADGGVLSAGTTAVGCAVRTDTQGLADGGALSAGITRIHRLQPFSPANYQGSEASFDATWADLARSVAQGLARTPAQPGLELGSIGWPEQRLRPAPEAMRDVTLTQLERFLRHPVQYFVHARLGVYLRDRETSEDDEPFALDSLEGYKLRQRLVDEALQNRAVAPALLAAEGLLPHGAFAGLTFDQARDRAAPLINRLGAYRGLSPAQVLIDIPFAAGPDGGPRRLVGQVAGIYPDLGLLRVRPGKLKGPDILGLWLGLLAWSAVGPREERHALLVAEHETFALTVDLAPEQAMEALGDYLDWYWEGLHRPLPVLPKASYAYAERTLAGKEPVGKVKEGWQGNAFQSITGDRDDADVRFVLGRRQGEPADFAGFAELSMALYEQVLALHVSTQACHRTK